MYDSNEEISRELMDRALPGSFSQNVIPEIPRFGLLRSGYLRAHPLTVYSVFVTVSLLLLGSMAVASLPA